MKLKTFGPPTATEDRYSFSNWVNDLVQTFTVGGNTYSVPVNTTMPGQKAEAITNSFCGYINGGLKTNGPIATLIWKRIEVFSQARFQFQQMSGGRPQGLFGTPDLDVFERPWTGGTTGDLLTIMLLDADLAGNAYVWRDGKTLVRLRPDWTDIILEAHPGPDGRPVAMRKAGYAYFHGGRQVTKEPVLFLPNEVAHFAPRRDPDSWYLGMSWLTPVIREIQADGAATSHKLKFFENAATPNLAVSLKDITDPKTFAAFVDAMEEEHGGIGNAYKTLYLGAGADVTVVGANLSQIDFKVTQGAGESRLASAAGVPAVVAGFSEGLQGSTLNAGNYGQARRQFADTTISSLWQNAAGSLELLVPPPAGARLWYDTRDVAFMREDAKNAAEITQIKAAAMKALVEAGYDPDTAKAAVDADDLSLLKHTGLYSVQLQPAGVAPAQAPA